MHAIEYFELPNLEEESTAFDYLQIFCQSYEIKNACPVLLTWFLLTLIPADNCCDLCIL